MDDKDNDKEVFIVIVWWPSQPVAANNRDKYKIEIHKRNKINVK